MSGHTPTWWTARLSLAAVTLSLGPAAMHSALMMALFVSALGLLAVHYVAVGLDWRMQWPAKDPTTVYRAFAADGTLLYVGISRCLERRVRQHAVSKAWWPQVSRIDTKVYRSRQAAAVAEWTAIETEGPRHNGTRLGHAAHVRSAMAR